MLLHVLKCQYQRSAESNASHATAVTLSQNGMINSVPISRLAFKEEGKPQENKKGKDHTSLYKEVKRRTQTMGGELV